MFQPAVPFDGLLGWRVLQRTYDTQFEAFSNSTVVQRDTEYFRENIASVESAEDLVADRRLLSVALGAFGLEADINNKFFIQKILEEGTANDDSLANRFSDTRYREFSAAFGFGPTELQQTKLSTFPDQIIGDYQRLSFEVAVGNQSQTLRIALASERTFEELAQSNASENAKWFEIMGQPPMRTLFETVFRLPTGFGQIDIDQQKDIFVERSQSMFGTRDPSDFADPDLQEELLTRYTALAQVASFNSTASSASAALTLLRGF